jgi:hypothetical protein
MILRNALEMILITIDIAYSHEDLEKWKSSMHDDLSKKGDWYFKTQNIRTRILSPQNKYPAFIREIANNIYDQWKIISNQTFYAHSYAQLIPLIDKNGNFSLFGRKDIKGHYKDFIQHGIFLINCIYIILELPKIKIIFSENTPGNEKARQIEARLAEIRSHYETNGRIVLELTSKECLKQALQKFGFPIDISGIPENALISRVEIDVRDPTKPKIIVDYVES